VSARHSERGSTLTEFSITALLFLTLIFGLIGFGEAMFTYDLVANAARIGSRYAMVRGTACTVSGCPTSSASVQTYVRSKVSGINTSQLAVTTSWQSSSLTGCVTASEAPGCVVYTSVTYPFRFALIPKYTFSFSSTSQMVISQ
jgi:Flp pilus assembly protein TadG